MCDGENGPIIKLTTRNYSLMTEKQCGNIYYLTNENTSSKRVLFFIHGFPDNYYLWKELLPYLNESFHLICSSAPGCVHPHKVKRKDFRLENLTKSYLDVLKQESENFEDLTLIAHDMGGPYAHEMLNHLPRSTKLICINTLSGQQMVHRKNNPEQLLRSSYMTLFQLPVISKKYFYKFFNLIRENAQILGRSDKDCIPVEYTSEILNGLYFYKALLLDMVSFLKKKKWDHDVLYIWSKNDPFLVRPTDKEFSQFYNNIKFKMIDAGHWPMLDDPKTVAGLINDFLSGGMK